MKDELLYVKKVYKTEIVEDGEIKEKKRIKKISAQNYQNCRAESQAAEAMGVDIQVDKIAEG